MSLFNFKTYQDLSFTIRKNIHKLPENIDLIVGIPRSGMIPAYMISSFLNKRCCSIDEYIKGIYPHVGERPVEDREIAGRGGRRVLIVDDSIHSGHSLTNIKKRLETEMDCSADTLYFCAVYAREESKLLVDCYFEVVPVPRMFQWNYLNHSSNKKSCFDIDGVLCVDPEPWQNDDGEKYIDFLRNAKPLYIPSYPIRALVTSRLEKYRPYTEEWLKKNHVQYEELYMLDLPSKAERIRLKAHGSFKAEIYKSLEDAELFIESNPKQAQEIALLAQKPAICTETDEVFWPGVDETASMVKNKLSLENKRILLCSHELTYTGAPYSLLRICRVLIKNGAKVELWSRIDGPFRREFEKLKVFVRIVPNEEIFSKGNADRIRTFDLAIANTVISHKYYLAARKFIPCIWYIREATNLPDICNNAGERLEALKNADELYCVSEYAKKFIEDNYNSHVRVVHNCVEDYYTGKINRPGKKINFAVIGTVTYRKAFDICIDAFEKLTAEEQEQCHLYFAGRLIGARKNYWEPILERAEKNPNITYVGEIENTEEKIKFFEDINCFIVVSRDESCSLVVLEGAMMGKPVIVSENVGAKYIVNEECGWIIETESVEKLQDVFRQIIRSPYILEPMGKAARKRYEETSTITIYEKNITEMVKSKLRRSAKQEYQKNSNTSLAYQLSREERYVGRLKKNLEDTTKKVNTIQEKLEDTQNSLKILQRHYDNMQASFSFRIGRTLTWFPRKIRGGICCVEEHGIFYTLKYIPGKIKNKLFHNI